MCRLRIESHLVWIITWWTLTGMKKMWQYSLTGLIIKWVPKMFSYSTPTRYSFPKLPLCLTLFFLLSVFLQSCFHFHKYLCRLITLEPFKGSWVSQHYQMLVDSTARAITGEDGAVIFNSWISDWDESLSSCWLWIVATVVFARNVQ